jgi:hemolysin III
MLDPKKITTLDPVKPLLRGHFHQAAFFIAMGACLMLLARTPNFLCLITAGIYSFTLLLLFGVSALYHRPNWNPRARARMRRLDHAAIFALIAGSAVPIALVGVGGMQGRSLLTVIIAGAMVGVVRCLLWITAPKWLSTILYVLVACLSVPFLMDLKAGLGGTGLTLLLVGGLIYIFGAVIYAVKRPNPWPHFFGYHEIFHILVVIAAAFHFVVILRLVN